MINDSDNPLDWVHNNLSIEDIVSIRSRTIRGGKELDVKVPDVSKVQEIALSSKPLDIEAAFIKPIQFDPTFDGDVTPTGLSGEIKKLEVIDNAKVTRIVDSCTSDTDLQAMEAARILFENGTDVYKIQNLLTAGLLGVERYRKVVPTRWAITATDDMLCSSYKKEIVHFPALPDFEVYCSKFHGNMLCFIMIPASDWKFEMLERWQKQSLWADEEESIIVDRESGMTKTKYSPIGGAYYAARLAALEYLRKRGHCAHVVCVRDISGEYWAPLGVWVIREGSHVAFSTQPFRCGTLKEAVDTAVFKTGTNFWASQIQMFRDMKEQKRIFDFF